MNQDLIGRSGSNISEDAVIKQRSDVLDQLHENIRNELSDRSFGIISYSPLKFIIAHKVHKQILYSNIKKKNNKNIKNDNDLGFYIETEVPSLNLLTIIINAIPTEITKHEDSLGFNTQNRYTMKFETSSGRILVIKTKTIDEIISELKSNALIFLEYKALEALSIIIQAFEKNNKIKIDRDIITPGFYLVDNKIRLYHRDNPKPTKEELKQCCEILDLIQTRYYYKRKDIFPTILKWTIIAPFDFVMKQKNKSWIPWLFLYGWSKTGKTTLGYISNCVWNNFNNPNHAIPFTAVDTKAKLGEAVSQSTYPLVINEVAPLSDDRYRDLLEMMKTAIEDMTSRKKFVNRTTYTNILSLCTAILTRNSPPPSDPASRRRFVLINFTQEDEYSEENQVKEFEKLFNERIKSELPIVGNFAANYILENQQLLLDGKKDWKEISEIILTEMYKEAGLNEPEWIKYFVQNTELRDSKEDVDLLFRSFLINKINDTYSKHCKSIDRCDVPITSFIHRLNICLENSLIPFLNTNADEDEIILTSDLIEELKRNRINGISSLKEVSTIINDFEYKQKKIGYRNVRAACGTRKEFLGFLGFEVKAEDNNF